MKDRQEARALRCRCGRAFAWRVPAGGGRCWHCGRLASAGTGDHHRTHRVTEAQLLAAQVGDGTGTVRLRPDWRTLGALLGAGGRLVVGVRAAGVRLRAGLSFERLAWLGSHAAVAERGTELALDTDRWASAFTVAEASRGEARRTVHVFDRRGAASLAVGIRGTGPVLGIIRCLAHPSQSPLLVVAAQPPPIDAPTADLLAIRTAWERLRDDHDERGLIERTGLPAAAAYPLLGADWAVELATDQVVDALERCAARGLRIAVGVASDGSRLVVRGTPGVTREGTRTRVRGPGWQLELRGRAGSLWALRCPRDGVITPRLELCDAGGRPILSITGDRRDPAGYDRFRSLHDELIAAAAV